MRALSKADRRTIRVIDDAGWLDPNSDTEDASGQHDLVSPSPGDDLLTGAHSESFLLASPVS
jgi:hypothetical protein